MTSNQDEYRPYTVPYSGSGGFAVGEGSCVSARHPEVATSFQGLSLSRAQDLAKANFRSPGMNNLCYAPAIASAPSSPSSGYMYNGGCICSDSPGEQTEEHINPYSPAYIQSGCVSPSSPSHLDPPFSRQSQMPSSFVGMPAGNTHGVYHMTQSEADEYNQEINEQARVAMIRSRHPPRPSTDALSSAMRIRYGPGSSLTPPSSYSTDANLAERRTESASTPQALDLATPCRTIHSSIRDGERVIVRHPSSREVGQASGKSAYNAETEFDVHRNEAVPNASLQPLHHQKDQLGAAGFRISKASPGTSDAQHSANPMYNCLSSPDLAKLSTHCACESCQSNRQSQNMAILPSIPAVDKAGAHKQSPNERNCTEGLTKPNDDAWATVQKREK